MIELELEGAALIIENGIERELWLREQDRYLANALGGGRPMDTVMRHAGQWADAAVESYRERLRSVERVHIGADKTARTEDETPGWCPVSPEDES